MSADPLADNPFERFRERVDRPLCHLFRTYGRPRLRWFGTGMVANLVARDADTIIMLKGGEVVERGTHDRLLEADRLYANLWRVQAGDIDSLPEAFVRRAAERRNEVADTDD